MKKVGGKTGQLVRSASRRGKTPSRFHFDISVERLFGPLVRPGSSYYVKWSRGVKVAQTKPVLAEMEHAGGSKVVGGLPIGQKMSLLVTLYRNDESSKNFDEKDARITVINVSSKGKEKAIAKMHFDLSQYAGVPSASLTKIIQVSDKISMKATIDSRLTKAGPSGPGSGGAGSAISGLSGNSSEGDEDGDADDFTDLSVNDVPESYSKPPSRQAVVPPPGSYNDSASLAASSVDPRRRPTGPSPALAAERSGSGPPASVSSSGSGSSVSRAMEIAKEMREQRERRDIAYQKEASAASEGTLEKKQSGRTGEYGSRGVTVGPGAGLGRSGGEEVLLRAELDALKEEHEKVLIDLRRVQDKRKRLEASHEAEVTALREKVVAASALGASSSSRSAAEYEAAQQRLAETTNERDKLRAECDTMRVAVRDAERYREKNKELSREVDRLTVAAASTGGAAGNAEFENRLARLQGEKEAMEGKLRAHQTHSAKVKETYQKLTTMYNQLREENVDLQGRLDTLEQERASSASVSERAPNAAVATASGTEIEALRTELRDAKQIARNVEASKDALQRDHDRLTAQLGSMQERLEQLTEGVREAREEADSLHAEVAEVTTQRDNALKRAEASRAGDRGFDRSAAAASEARLAEAMAAREQTEREGVRIRQRVMELERELGDLTEDLEYEKAEKAKAREERDALRESARALEKRTSEASQAADAVHVLKRQLSTHKMRDVDQTAMIADLREEVDRLQSELDDLRMRNSGAGAVSHGGMRSGSEADVLETLVITKLALATAEDEKLQLQFGMKTLRANEKAIQERLAAHASRLEVKLSEANDELEKYRRRLSNAECS